MKTNDAQNSRSENAKNEKRDSQGRFTSSSSNGKKEMSHSSKTKSEHTKDEKKNSESRSTPRDKK